MADPAVPAIRKIAAAMMQAIATARPDLHGFIDRSQAEPLNEGQWPGYVLRYEVKWSLAPDLGQYYHTATMSFECQSGNSAGATLDLTNQRSVADIHNALMADPSLGGRLDDLQPIGSDQTQPESADVGSAVLQMQATYYTLIHDINVIVGVGGQQFP